MRGIAGAAALALALVGCGTEWWRLIPLDASVVPLSDESMLEAGGDDTVGDATHNFGYCNSESDCSKLGQHCDTKRTTCVDCMTDSDCKQLGASHCDNRNKCVQCVSLPIDTCGPGQICDETECFYSCPDGGGCPPFAPLCNTNSGRFVCASCLTNDDCADAAVPSYCKQSSGACTAYDQPIGPSPGPDASNALDASDVAAEAPWVGDAADGGG